MSHRMNHGRSLGAAAGPAARLFLALGLGGGSLTSQAALTETVSPAPGVAYYRDVNPRQPLTVHVVRIDRARKDLEFHTTLGGRDQIGMAVLSEQAHFISPRLGEPVAAINGDYFYLWRPFVGDPMNLQILRGGELVSGPGEDRAFFYLDAQGQPHVTNAVEAFTVTWPGGKTTPVGLNESPEPGRAVLYTAAAGPSTRVEGFELILENAGKGPWLPLRVGQQLTAKVRQINRTGFSRLSPECLVLSFDPRTVRQLPAVAVGAELIISTATKPDLSGATLAIGGGPTLVRGGKARPAHEFEGFQSRHPRSAMGWNDQYYYFVQADGRQPRYSMGMTLSEMAEYFVRLKCEAAINLDGGGSCTTWVGGQVVNSPSQGRERPSANALVVVRKNPTGPVAAVPAH